MKQMKQNEIDKLILDYQENTEKYSKQIFYEKLKQVEEKSKEIEKILKELKS